MNTPNPSQAEEIKRLRDTLTTIDNWLVCSAITTAEDMAQSFLPMHQLIESTLGPTIFGMKVVEDSAIPEGEAHIKDAVTGELKAKIVGLPPAEKRAQSIKALEKLARDAGYLNDAGPKLRCRCIHWDGKCHNINGSCTGKA